MVNSLTIIIYNKRRNAITIAPCEKCLKKGEKKFSATSAKKEEVYECKILCGL